MKKKIHLSKFNLVEIVLAIGVVALGMAAVLALLPPALNANSASQGDANATEIASNMITYIDSVVQDCAKETTEFKKVDPADTRTPEQKTTDDENTWNEALDKRFKTGVDETVKVPGDSFTNTLDTPFGNFNVESGTKEKPGWMTYITTDASDNKIPVANVYVWMKKITDPGVSSTDKINDIGATPNKRSCYRFYIKVCWPADAPADAENREERTFVHEVVRPVKH